VRDSFLHRLAILLGIWISVFVQTMCGQSVPPMAPLPRMDAPPTIMLPRGTTETTAPRERVNPGQLRSEARQLLELSQSVQADFEQVSRGLLPKDLVDKLKRIEKLTKNLRSQINK